MDFICICYIICLSQIINLVSTCRTSSLRKIQCVTWWLACVNARQWNSWTKALLRFPSERHGLAFKTLWSLVLQFKNERCLGLAENNASVALSQSFACHSPSLSADDNLCKSAITCSWTAKKLKPYLGLFSLAHSELGITMQKFKL